MAKRPSSGFALALAVAFTAAGGCARGRAAEDGRGPKAVKAHVVPVASRSVQRTVDSVGSLFPFEEVTVGAEVEGRVAQVFVDVGDAVSRGRALVKIVPVELGLTLEQERAALEQIQTRLTTSGGGVLKDPKEAAEVKRADADRTDAEQKYLRAKELFAQGLISRGTFDEAEARYNGARAGYDMAVQNVLTLRAQAAQRTASVALAGKKLSDTVIRAPFEGHVKDRMVSPGQYVKVQTPVMVIVDTNRLRARLKVPEKMAGWVAVGQPVKVQVEAYPDRAFEGAVSRMSPSVDPQTRSFDVEALLDNRDGVLKPGFFARASIVSSRVDQALVVPQDALRYLYGVYKVYTVEQSALRETEVKLGAREGADVEIVSGLKEGAQVAVPLEGEEMRDGALVEAVK
ncbi:MAG TPA: efflux RND transporter periplasmic adaptor subunit [Vicinamibacteria bacterium]|nr:efflux RND transporter periplasmic adaptor subunit [Vicinamibacteria bacterium]